MRLEDSQLSELVLDAVRRDDLNAFNGISQKDNRCFLLQFGRFNMLSLCYVLGAKKIAAEYEKRFLEAEVFDEDGIAAPEPPDAYKILKECAGTNLRLYASATVSPAEALALTRQTDALKQKFIQLNPTEKAKENILKIYSARGKAARIENGALRVAGESLKKRDKLLLAVLSGVAALFIAVFFVFAVLINLNIGAGTKNNPAKIKSVSQLLAAADKDGKYILTTDLRLPLGFEIEDFKGSLDGGGHSVTASDKPFALKISGSIKNIKYTAGSQSTSQKLFAAEITGLVENIEYDAGKFDFNADADFAFFALKNTGIIKNVSVSLTANITEASAADLTGAALILDNTGEIKDCTASGVIDIKGNGTGEFLFAAIAGKNSGVIENCLTLQGTQIKSDSADLAGIVCQNLDGGRVADCVNNAVLRHSGARQKWNPVSAGICISNGGTMSGCINKGEITSISSNTNINSFLLNGIESTAQVYAAGIVHENLTGAVISAAQNQAAINAYSYVNNTYAAGIAALNYGAIKGSVNSGNILSRASIPPTKEQNDRIEVYAAGIAGRNRAVAFDSGRIEKCKNSGDISAFSDINIIYAAGIAAYNDGEIINNGSVGKIKCTGTDDVTVFAGGIIALCDGGGVNNNYSAMAFGLSGDAAVCSGGIIGFAYASRQGENLYLQMYSIEENYYVRRESIPQTALGIGLIYIRDEGWSGGTDYGSEAADEASVLKMISEI